MLILLVGGFRSLVWFVVAVMAMGDACARTTDDSIAACRASSRAGEPGALALCERVYAKTKSPLAGGLVAHGLLRANRSLDEIRAIADRIGDVPGGAEAWNAVGELLMARGEIAPSIAAFEHALSRRAPDEIRGRIRDATALQAQYARAERYRAALGYAGLAYQLAIHDDDLEARGYVIASLASMLFQLGAVPAAESLLVDADKLIDSKSIFAPHLISLHALIDWRNGRLALAEQGLRRASERAHALGLSDLERNVAWSRVHVALERGDVAEATNALASDGVDGQAFLDDQSQHSYSEALIALARKAPGEALRLSDAALAHSNGASDAQLLGVKGRALLELHEDRNAEQTLLRAIAAVEQRREAVQLDELKPWVMQGEFRQPFEDLFTLYVTQQRNDDAFEIVQRASARSLLDGLLTKGDDHHDSLATELEKAGDRVDGVRALAHSLRTSAPQQVPCTEALRKKLGDRSVITFTRARDVLWRISLVPGHAVVIARVGTVAEVSSLVQRWLRDLDNRAQAELVGQHLISADGLPADGRPVFVSVDDSLREVPFAALVVSGELLVEHHPVVYVPSAAVLAQLAGSPKARGDAVVIGDPRNNLPAAREESLEVARTLRTTALIGNAATGTSLVEAGHASLLHIGAHSEKTSRGTALLLADKEILASDVIDKAIGPATVVLMSCASADPGDRDELGPLAAAFLAAGTHTVVASRWSVSDSIARSFSRAFYAAHGAEDPVGAVASAQRALIRDGVPASIWTTFVVFGDSDN